MKILNLFQIHSWKIKSLAIFVFSAQIALLGSICLSLIGLQVPLLRQFIGLIYLLFIPGILILRILKISKIGSIESLLYTIGLSIAFIIFVGFFMNSLYPYFGILKPISIIPLVITISFIILVLSIFCYYKDENYCNYTYFSSKKLFSPISLFLSLIPFLAIFGAYFVNSYHNNSLIIIFIISISFIVFLNGFYNFIPENLYCLAIFTIGLALLFHNSLISTYLWGCDIQSEYYLSNQIINNSYWNSGIEQNTNSMLSIVMLAPIISKICNINLVWVFKVIFPLLYSLLPVGMYKIFEKQTTPKIAFLSCLFFILGFEFYSEMLTLARQQIAEIFFSLLILLTINESLKHSKKVILSLMFMFSIIVSHYGFSYIFLLSLLLSLIISKFIIFSQKNYLNSDASYNLDSVQKYTKRENFEKIISVNFLILAFVFSFAWYIYTSHGSPFFFFVHAGNSIYNQIFSEFFKTQSMDIITASASSSMRNITKYLHLIGIFFIIIGVFKLAINRKILKFNNTYVSFSFAFFLICVFGVTVPSFAISLNTSRLYYMTLIILAPFFSIGGIIFFNFLIHRNFNIFWKNNLINKEFMLLSIFLAVFFLFNSGLMYEINRDESSSVSLNSAHYPYVYSKEEICAANWVSHSKNINNFIYSDCGGYPLLAGITPDYRIFIPNKYNYDIYVPKMNYIFFTKLNTIDHKLYVTNVFTSKYYIDIKHLILNNKINTLYDSGSGKIGFVENLS
jgi:Predicted membrane protein